MRHARPRRPIHDLLGDILDLVHPRDCSGCGRAGAVLCPDCASTLRAGAFAHRPTPAPTGLPPCFAAAPYDGPVRSAIVAWKERGERDLTSFLAASLARAVAQAVASCGLETPAIIVPVPASATAKRSRGDDILLRLARCAARSLTRHGHATECRQLLRVCGAPRDQSGLSRAERLVNLRGSLAPLTTGRARLPHRPVVIVDDVLTTGATLAEATRALTEFGVDVAAAATVAATLRRG